MRFATWALSAVLLLSDAASAKAISLPAHLLGRSNDYEEIMRKAISSYDQRLERRSPLPSNSPSVNSSDTTTSATVVAACTTAISAMTSVNNSAGFAGCYNILAWDPKTLVFQADLRIYQQAAASGIFANISSNQITVRLDYPASTQYKPVAKRSTIELSTRDGSSVQIQQYSLAGSLTQPINVSKLNQTMLASLMIPQITLQATTGTTQKSISTNMTAADTAWFVAGQFTITSAQATQAANPATASAAVKAAQPFVLPGQTFGIFPTGFIVTSVWTVLFFLAFGLGTVGRIKSRNYYRKRIVGMASRTRL